MLTHGFLRFRLGATVKLIAVTMLAGLAAMSCQKMPLVAPSGTAIALVPSNNVVAVNGSTSITAVLIEGGLSSGGETTGIGTPVHNGTVVTFTTTLGRVEPAEAKTQAGKVTVRLIADGRSGIAVVTAFSGAAAQALELPIGAGAAERIAITADPQALPGTGGSTTISARVEEGNGNAIAGVPVSFSATQGTLSRPNSLTNEDGIATTVLTTTRESVVTANAGSTSADLAASVTITVRPRTAVTLATPASATVGVPAAFTVTPAANSVLSNVELSFGDGQTVSLGGITGATNVSHIFRSPGTKQVSATSTDSLGDRATVSTQVSVAPLQLTLLASPATVQNGTFVTFTATPSAGAVIERYVWDFGDGSGPVQGSNQMIRSYPSAGVRIVSVQAFPFGGGTPATALATVQVNH